MSNTTNRIKEKKGKAGHWVSELIAIKGCFIFFGFKDILNKAGNCMTECSLLSYVAIHLLASGNNFLNLTKEIGRKALYDFNFT